MNFCQELYYMWLYGLCQMYVTYLLQTRDSKTFFKTERLSQTLFQNRYFQTIRQVVQTLCGDFEVIRIVAIPCFYVVNYEYPQQEKC